MMERAFRITRSRPSTASPRRRNAAPIIGKLNAAINEGLLTATTKETLAKLGAVASPGSPEEFASFIAAELAKWKSVAQQANVKID